MTTHRIHYLTCDQCGKTYMDNGYVSYGEEPECIQDMAQDDGWLCGVEVPNGSLWDFCSKKCGDAD